MRQSGILLHITSLPGPFGVGTMGKQAFAFVDFLKQAGQSYWQILPLTPTGFGDSPYQSCSAYAGNLYLIDLPTLVKEGLLTEEEICSVNWESQTGRVDFGLLYQHRSRILRMAYSRFQGGENYDRFCRENSDWLPDYALFMALKDRFDGQPWYRWETALRRRDPDAIWNVRRELREEIRFYCFQQFQFFRQWNCLREYAHKNGIRMIGDVPIYVPYDSVDVWASPEYFQLDETLTPTDVAGCPPDGFTEDGQLWGNPLYRWKEMAREKYSWWMRRLEAAGRVYDVIRIDHFRGLEAYWAVPYGDTTARGGRWVKGPGMDFIKVVKKQLPDIALIAEDLGFLTQEVLDLRDESGLPGMKVLQFAFDSREPSEYLPYQYPKNCVCYTGTHDNMTTRQWLETIGPETLAYAKAYMQLNEEEGYVWGVIRTAMASVAELCIVPMQDYLDLGSNARMNFPGTQTDANWTWRAASDAMDPALADKIRQLTGLYGRR